MDKGLLIGLIFIQLEKDFDMIENQWKCYSETGNILPWSKFHQLVYVLS